MTSYVALLRGIGPSNPNMRNEHLRRVVEGLGHSNVRTVISSGNVLFESDSTDPAPLEAEMEAAWQRRLGFTSTTIVRSRERIERLVAADPYRGLEHGPETYLLVTFFKRPPSEDLAVPHRPPGKPYRVEAVVDHTMFSVIDTTAARTPDLMGWLELRYGKEISSRTWKTVQRVLARM